MQIGQCRISSTSFHDQHFPEVYACLFTVVVNTDINKEFKKLQRLLQRKHHFKI